MVGRRLSYSCENPDMATSLHIVCPACNTINRVPEVRLSQAPACGNCKKPLFAGHPVELTETSFDTHINRGDIPVVVDFWADWCGPCKMMAPHFVRAAQQMEPRLRFAKLDTEAAQVIAGRYGIRSIPTLIVFLHGKEVARQSGAVDTATLVKWLTPLAKVAPSTA
jgi:thioredoxin 2